MEIELVRKVRTHITLRDDAWHPEYEMDRYLNSIFELFRCAVVSSW